jgi:ATP-dependent Zn protease
MKHIKSYLKLCRPTRVKPLYTLRPIAAISSDSSVPYYPIESSIIEQLQIQKPITSKIHITSPSQAPSLKSWNYSTFIYKVTSGDVECVKITQDQRYIYVYLKDHREESLLLPDGYDVINFLIQYNIPVHIDSPKKLAYELSILDITLIICQCVFLYFVVTTILRKRTDRTNSSSADIISTTSINTFANIKNDSFIIDPNVELAAYRESGQLISNLLLNNIDSIDSISIDNATQFPNKNVATNVKENRQNLEDKLKIIIGGRVAEEIIFGAMRSSSGKSSDLEIAIQLAYDIIATYGFSRSLSVTDWDNFNTPQIQENIEKYAKYIIKRVYKESRKVMIKNRQLLDNIAEELMKQRILYKDDIRRIILKTYKNTRKVNKQILKHLNNSNIKCTYK